MTVRRLDDNGDITTSGKHFINEREEIAQTIRTRLKLFYGEYFRDNTDGTPWFQSILGKNKNPNAREAIIRRRIIETDGVTQLTSFKADFDLAQREYKIDATVLTNYGEIAISQEGI